MKFMGYATRDLNVADKLYRKTTGDSPEAFMVRSPFRISGTVDLKKKLVVSPKYGGSGAVYVPLMLDKDGLERLIERLGDESKKRYVARRELEEALIRKEIERKTLARTYNRNCNYCAIVYATDVLDPVYHCSQSTCRMKHKEYLMELTKRRREQRDKVRLKEADEEKKLPEFSMENPASRSLQGWIYFIEAQNGYVKIGRSDDPSSRFLSIVNMSPVPIWLRHTVFSDNFVVAENTAHEMFIKYRRHGEWFELPEDVLDGCLGLDNYDLDPQ